MKKIIFIILATFTLAGCFPAMDLRPAMEADLTFEEVIKAEGLSKDYLYSNIKFWVVDTFKSAKNVIEYDNATEGTIICKGIIPYPCDGGMDCLARAGWNVMFTMRIDTKDNKFKVNFSNLKIAFPGSQYAPPGEAPLIYQAHLEKAKPRLIALQSTILPYIKSPRVSKDW